VTNKASLGCFDFGQWRLPLNGALAEDGGLGCAPECFVVMLQRQQQRQVGIATKGGGVGALGDGP
jgi:hypothetical protein